MDWLTTLLDPSVISTVMEAVLIAIFGGRWARDKWRIHNGSVYRVRLTVERGEFLYQIDSLLVPIQAKMFNYLKGSYFIEPESIQFYDPAPTLIYVLGSALPLTQTELKEHKLIPERDLSADWVNQYVEQEVVKQVIQAGKGSKFSYETLALGAAIGAIVMLFLVPYLPFKV